VNGRSWDRTLDTVNRPTRVLYSFPHRIGAGRICYTAWHQVAGLVEAGADVTVFPASVHKPLPGARVVPTLSRGRVRIPPRIIGEHRALELHDRIVARRLLRLAGHIDVVHAWPLGAFETLKVAKRLGIPTALERPNAHTRFAFEIVRDECDRIGVALPRGHEHAFNAAVLEREEAEYELADRLLCPSDFVVQTFLDKGFAPEKLARHIYGYDPRTFHPSAEPRRLGEGITALYVGVAAVRKGLHLALDAWLRSPASREGRFLIAGEMLPAYGEYLRAQLAHPSVEVLGHRDDVPALMRTSDIFILPSIEEGFGLVCTEAMGSGCVPLVSDACTELCRHGDNALVHRAGDVAALEQHITAVDHDRDLLARLRRRGLETAPSITWTAAGTMLLGAYAGRSGAAATPVLVR
jgi:glycosyltransferase involved in cell wall biosynthesis